MDRSQDRRHFLLSTLGVAAYATPFAGFLLNACKTTASQGNHAALSSEEIAYAGVKTVRRSATDPRNSANIELYRKAVEKMKVTPFPILSGDKTITWWEAHAEIHNNHCPHGNWFFLPWHRAYLHYFELVCREFCGDASFALPYWDWSEDSALPEAFTTGDEATNPLFNGTRSFKNRQALGVKECGKENVDKILEISDFSTFAGGSSDRPRKTDNSIDKEIKGSTGRLEGGPHNKVHAVMQGDMGTFISPRDPVFWLHHCNVDRLWTCWVSERAAKYQDVLPADPAPDAADARLNRNYWLSAKVGGFYAISKDGDSFKAAPADIAVGELVDASKLGLSYEWIAPPAVPATPVEPAVPAIPVEPAIPAVPAVPVEPAVPAIPATPVEPAVPATPAEPAVPATAAEPAVPAIPAQPAPGTIVVTPTPASSLSGKARFRNAVKKVIILRTKFVSKLGVAGNAPVVIRVEASPALDSALVAAAKNRGNEEATLRLVVKNIPFPTNPKGELLLYLNSATSKGEEKNAEFIGSLSFFGHKHVDATVSAAFDLVPTIKKLAASGKKPSSGQPLLVSAVWKSNPSADDLSALALSLDYLELG